MRNYETLDTITENDGQLQLTHRESGAVHGALMLAQEGDKIVISASVGVVELALRLRLDEFKRQVAGLKHVPGLTTTRQVGTVQAFIWLGLTENNELVLRPTLLVDATGKLTFNMIASEACYQRLVEWLNVKK